MTAATVYSDDGRKVKNCGKDIPIVELTVGDCRTCSLCNYNHNCNGDSVNLTGTDAGEMSELLDWDTDQITMYKVVPGNA